MAKTPQQDAAEHRPPASLTLSKGLRILEILADSRDPLSIDEIASRLDSHRSVGYRLLRTLEQHGLVVRDAAGMFVLGARMAALAAGVARDVQSEALPELTAIANELGVTCFLGVLDRDECITLLSVEPRHAIAPLAQRPGARHPVTAGAPGKAILTQLREADWPGKITEKLRAEVTQAALDGYATSRDEVIPTVQSVAVPLVLRGQRPAAIAVVHIGDRDDTAEMSARLQRAAAAITSSLDG